jgi:pilus assembly protein CpaC
MKVFRKLKVSATQLLVICLFILSCITLAANTKKYVKLTIGLTDEIKVPNMPSTIGDDLNYNRNIVHIAVARQLKTIRFEPVAVGTTNFILRNDKGSKIAEYIISVVKANDRVKIAAEIKNLLGDIEGITIKVINNKVVVDGEVLLPKDMNRIVTVLAQYPKDQADYIVTMSPIAQKKIAGVIENDIGNPEIHVRAVNDKFILEGVAGSEGEKSKAELIAKLYVPDVVVDVAESIGVVKKRKIDSVVNLLSVKPSPETPPGKTVKIIVHYVELNKNYNKGFRFQWTPSLKEDSGVQFSSGSGSSAGGVLSTITGTISDLLPKLNFAKAHGHARVLQSSSIIVQEGVEGTIQSGTRVPYSAQNQFGQITTTFADTGLNTAVKPFLVSAKSDGVRMEVKFSIKALVGETEKGPLINERNITTSVIVRSGQSAAIGGLVGNDSSMDYNRLPKGASDPILSLYSSKLFQKNQSQFVVFITPVILNSASDGSDEVKKKFRLKE